MVKQWSTGHVWRRLRYKLKVVTFTIQLGCTIHKITTTETTNYYLLKLCKFIMFIWLAEWYDFVSHLSPSSQLSSTKRTVGSVQRRYILLSLLIQLQNLTQWTICLYFNELVWNCFTKLTKRDTTKYQATFSFRWCTNRTYSCYGD